MLNKAMKLMDQRDNMINEAYEVLRVLDAKDVTEVQPVTNITINKGKIVAVEITKEIVKEVQITNEEELNRVYDENARHIRRINELTEETIALENEIAFKDGQMISLNKQVKELEDKVAELQAALNAKKLTKVKPMQDELKDYKEELDKEADAVEYNDAVLNKLKADLAKAKELVNKQTAPNMKSAYEKKIAKLEKQIEERINELANDKDTIEIHVADKHSKALYGTVTIDNKVYNFRATANHAMPIVYGAMNMEIINKVKNMIENNNKMMNRSFYFCTAEENEFDNVIYDFDNNAVIWRTHEGHFKGYNDTYIFAWDGKADAPMRKLFKNALLDKKSLWKPMTKTATGSTAMEAEGKRLMALCEKLFDKNATEYTNEIVVNTNDTVANTKDEEIDPLEGAYDME